MSLNSAAADDTVSNGWLAASELTGGQATGCSSKGKNGYTILLSSSMEHGTNSLSSSKAAVTSADDCVGSVNYLKIDFLN